MVKSRPRWRHASVLIAAVVFVAGGAFTGAAQAGYWNFQGWLYPNPTEPYTYGEYTGATYNRFIRLSRSNCAPKMQIHSYFSGWYQINLG